MTCQFRFNRAKNKAAVYCCGLSMKLDRVKPIEIGIGVVRAYHRNIPQ